MWVNGRYVNDEYKILDNNDVDFLRSFILAELHMYWTSEKEPEFNRAYPANMLWHILDRHEEKTIKKGNYSYLCPTCGWAFVDEPYAKRDNYCCRCGQRLKWEW